MKWKYIYCEDKNEVWKVSEAQLYEIREYESFVKERSDLASILRPANKSLPIETEVYRKAIGAFVEFDKCETKRPVRLAKKLLIDGLKDSLFQNFKPYILSCIFPRKITAKSFKTEIELLNAMDEWNYSVNMLERNFDKYAKVCDIALCLHQILEPYKTAPYFYCFDFSGEGTVFQPYIIFRKGKIETKKADYEYLYEFKEKMIDEMERILSTGFPSDVSEKQFDDAVDKHEYELEFGTFDEETKKRLSEARRRAFRSRETKYEQFYRNEFVYMLNKALEGKGRSR